MIDAGGGGGGGVIVLFSNDVDILYWSATVRNTVASPA